MGINLGVCGNRMTESFDIAVSDWVEFLSDDQLPVLAESVQNLTDLTGSEDVRVSALTDQVLKDPNLTSRLLQIANSASYRSAGGQITTVSRAIIWLGFTSVRDITLSMKVLDTMLEQHPSNHLLGLIAQGYHSAMQARWLVDDIKHTDREEAFISALLRHVGEMAFLSRDDEVSRKLNNLIELKGKSPLEAAQEILGCSFEDITVGLARKWQLSSMITESILVPEAPRHQVRAILLSEELCTKASKGWDHEEVEDVIKRIAKFKNVSAKDCRQKVQETADAARELAIHYGAARVKHLIPGSDITIEKPLLKPVAGVVASQENSKSKAEAAKSAVLPDKASSGVNSALQMQKMQDITAYMTNKKLDINLLFRTAMDGVVVALGLKRVGLSLMNKERKQLICKTVLGGEPPFNDALNTSLDKENIFTQAIKSAKPVWIGTRAMAGKAYLLTDTIKIKTKSNHCLVAPIVVSGKPIGIIYADSGPHGGEITDQQYSGFCMFIQQVSMVLTTASAMRPSS